MSDDARLNVLRERLGQSDSVAAIREVIAELERLMAEPPLRRASEDLVAEAFATLRELTAGNPDEAVSVLIDDVLPRCFVAWSADQPTKARYDIVFGEWLSILPEDSRWPARDVALARAVAALSQAPRYALNLIASIGYWNKDVLDALDAQIRADDGDIGDHALSVRSWLCPSDNDAAWLVQSLHQRIVQRANMYLLTAAHAIGVADTADLVSSYWLEQQDSKQQHWMLDLTLDLLVKIASRYRDTSLTERVWVWLLGATVSGARQHVLAFNSGLAPRVDSPSVVKDLLKRASTGSGREAYLYHLRLCECAERGHMLGWERAPLEEFARSRAEAVKSSGVTGRDSTIELDEKLTAWSVLLCRGNRSVLPPLDDVLAGEESGYVVGEILSIAGCLAVGGLPKAVEGLVAGRSEAHPWKDQEKLAAQIGAIHVAHGAAAKGEAFRVLLGYRPLGRGVLLSLIQALADTADGLTGEAKPKAVKALFEAAEAAANSWTREAAAGAIAALVERNRLGSEEIGRAAALTIAQGTGATRELLFAFARSDQEIPESVVNYAKRLLDVPVAANARDPRPAALLVTARRPDAWNDEEFLARRLGLRSSRLGSDAGSATRTATAPHVVGRLFSEQPDRFATAVAALLMDGDTATVAQLLPFVRRTRDRTPRLVTNAIVSRLRRADQGLVAEPSLIDVLAEVDVGRLLTDASERLEAWLPQARVAVAEAAGRVIDIGQSHESRRFTVLVRMMGDGLYAVRRAAYRAAARCSPDRFVELVQSWSSWRERGRLGPRRQAAESVGWLDARAAASLGSLAWDQEPSVRDAYSRSIAERQDRARAEEYEAHVISVEGPDDVITAWRYGVALGQVGDDETVSRLTARLRDKLAPSVRFWLSRVRKDVDRRWNGVTRKWPEPWFARPGDIETFSGVVRVGDRQLPINGTLWRMDPAVPGDFGSWGGWGKVQGTAPGADEAEWELQLIDRRAARVLITSAELFSGALIFVGNGPYPDNV